MCLQFYYSLEQTIIVPNISLKIHKIVFFWSHSCWASLLRQDPRMRTVWEYWIGTLLEQRKRKLGEHRMRTHKENSQRTICEHYRLRTLHRRTPHVSAHVLCSQSRNSSLLLLLFTYSSYRRWKRRRSFPPARSDMPAEWPASPPGLNAKTKAAFV